VGRGDASIALRLAPIWHAANRESGAYLHSLAASLVPDRERLSDDEWLELGSSRHVRPR